MRAAVASLIDAVPWDELQHAYGAASDVPVLLHSVATAKGRKLYDAMDELCSRVLHQGTIYSASPAVARAVIGMLAGVGPRERTSLDGLLTGFAESAREAIATGHAIPCHSGGDPVDGVAIRDAILDAHHAFQSDLTHSDAELRAQAAELLTAFADADPAMARLVRDHYSVEADPIVRRAMFDGLERVHASFEDWPAFLAATLERETAIANRYLLRRAQVDHRQSGADAVMVDEMVATFVALHTTEYQIFVGDEPFFRAVHLLGADRELAALLQALENADNHGLSRVLAERLLRLVFADQRSGWEDTSFSYQKDEDGRGRPGGSAGSLYKSAFRMLGLALLAKFFPSLLRRKLRRSALANRDRVETVKYWGVKGDPPAIPGKLTESQTTVLTALARDAAVWRFRTNLWELFGLPSTADALTEFVLRGAGDSPPRTLRPP